MRIIILAGNTKCPFKGRQNFPPLLLLFLFAPDLLLHTLLDGLICGLLGLVFGLLGLLLHPPPHLLFLLSLLWRKPNKANNQAGKEKAGPPHQDSDEELEALGAMVFTQTDNLDRRMKALEDAMEKKKARAEGDTEME
ncbi:hypothetical protein N7492_007884 [Penicillium capsulatum]|uniref:Uncharacterized protein n=1 Tax=Penicillium capsulatum TaxID=69766 RepID=A0A9W9I3A4_9EURO|nr:hypothetical protein N7492_007884 [Penicillium capsulatum]